MIRITGMNSGLDTDTIIKELMSAYKTKGDKYKKAQTKLSWKQDKWKTLNSKIYKFYTSLDKMRYSAGYALKKTSISDATKATVTADGNAANGTQSLKINEVAKSAYLTGGTIDKDQDGKFLILKDDAGNPVELSGSTKISDLDRSNTNLSGATNTGDIKFELKSGDVIKQIELSGSSTIDDVVDAINKSGMNVKASYDNVNKRISIASKTAGAVSDFELTADPTSQSSMDALKALRLDKNDTGVNKAAKSDAKDAEIELNGAIYKSNSNTFNINGLTIQALAKTNGEELAITTATDTQGLYDKIKDFISDYNSLINEMSTLYNADSSKGYEPLTSEEKEALSEKEIEEWESKIKDSLLRRDDTLSSVMSTMTTAMMGTVQIGDKKYSLASLGIKTGGYFNTTAGNRNELHIDGDEDDDTVSGNTNQLMNMLNSDPDKVITIFKGITDNLSKEMYKKMKPTSLRSVHTVYNDKEMAQSYSDYTKTIRQWEEKMQKIEDSYYKKFSAMEVALGKLQSQSSSFSSMLGM